MPVLHARGLRSVLAHALWAGAAFTAASVLAAASLLRGISLRRHQLNSLSAVVSSVSIEKSVCSMR